jgi:ABC-type glycerol-3-phosphate transport system substrate-binding protein
MKKHISVILALITVLAMLAACGGNDGGGTATQTAPPQQVNTPPPTGNEGGEDNGEEGDDEIYRDWQEDAGFKEVLMDLDGREVVILTMRFEQFNSWDPIDATPNETIDMMNRMREIEEEYNMEFKFEAGTAGSVISQLRMNRAVGDTPWDMVHIGTNHTTLDQMFQDGLVMDLNHPSVKDVLNFENNPWSAETNLTSFFGKQFGAHFHTANSGLILRACVAFNREYADRFNLPNLYDMVWNKTWTFTAMENILAAVARESGGAIIPLVADRESQLVPHLIIANGGAVTENTPDGLLFVAHENQQTLDAMEYVQRLITNNLLQLGVTHFAADNLMPMVAGGEVMFVAGSYENLRRLTRQDPPTEFSFGLLPIPKGDDMDDYVAPTHAADMFFIVDGVKEPQEVAAVLVAMANRLSKINIIMTELYFGVQDNDSALILEMLLERIVVDYSRATGARNRITDAVNQIVAMSATPRAAFESFATQIQTSYDNMRPR